MSERGQKYHVPVMLLPSVDGLNVRPDGTYVDVTFGGGGHSREILSRLDDKGRLLGFDQDEDAEQNIPEDSRFTFVRGNFRFLHNFLRYYGIEQVDGIFADLGVSWHHFDDEERGFSFRFNSILDMRMNRNASLRATDVVNNYDEKQLADIFYLYGEFEESRRIASALVRARQKSPVVTVQDLLNALPKIVDKKDMARIFQALRIEVNHEMDALREMLLASVNLLQDGGRLVVITYHSLEDRMVKNVMKTGNVNGEVEKDFFGNALTPFKIINNKIIVPDSEEIIRNPRSRSAKLRIAEKRRGGK